MIDSAGIGDAKRSCHATNNIRIGMICQLNRPDPIHSLFLDHSGLAALAKLINPALVNDDILSDMATQVGTPLAYRFYLTGALGVGKSTAANHLRNLDVLDEWMEPRPLILAKPWDLLTPLEKGEADEWIASQFKLKNDSLRHKKKGIFLVDRPPLDPLAFTPIRERKAKARFLLQTICPGRKWTVAEGVVILLKGEPSELSVRLPATGRAGYTTEKLQEMQDDLSNVYDCKGVVQLNTCGMSIAEVTKQVADIIHFHKYEPCHFSDQLKKRSS
jgi:broad-specificity NMP kinase